MANSGFETEAAGAEALLARNFRGFDYIVGPSGSWCVHHIRNHFTAIEQTPAVPEVRARTYELVEFLHDVLKVDAFLGAVCAQGRPPQFLRHAAGARPCEGFGDTGAGFRSPAPCCRKSGLELVAAARPDECCGSGGTFSIVNEAVSAKMGHDKVVDFAAAGAQYIASADSSCLMHQRGLRAARGTPIKFIHIAQILNGDAA